MQPLFISEDWGEVMQALKSMYPGKRVVYGWYYSYEDAAKHQWAVPERLRIREQITELLLTKRIMCFHVRVKPPIYPRKRTALVACGVVPAALMRLEAALDSHQLPKRKLKK